MKNKIKVSIIGTGRIGLSSEFDSRRLKPASHFGMWLKNKDCNLVSICDKNKSAFAKAKKFKKNIKFYNNYKDMIKIEKPDIISICTWKDTHFSITKECLKLGIKVIILEKPLANNLIQAKALVKLVKKNKAKILVNHRRRYDEEIIKLKRKINNGIIGDILQISSFYVYGILTTGTHLIDTLRMLLKDRLGDVNKVIGIKNKLNNFKPKDDKNIDGFLLFKNNILASIQSLDMKSYDNFDIIIYGRKGKIEITDIGRRVLHYKIIKSPEHMGFTELTRKPIDLCKPKPRNQFGCLSKNAVLCLKSKNAVPLCDENDSLKDMDIINKLIASSQSNGKVIKV